MFDHGLEYLKKLLPEFEKKPEQATSQPTAQTPASAKPPTAQPSPPKPNGNPAEMLDRLAAFLRQYLAADDYNINVLALWVLHTYCYQHFHTATYLDIHSIEPYAGKTRCLELLNVLCRDPWLATGADPNTILDKLLIPDCFVENVEAEGKFSFPAPHTILLDDCHHTFGPSERQPLLALLNTGSRRHCRYLSGRFEFSVFGPKAFAGKGRLLPSLAGRCIPITLRRMKRGDTLRRFDPSTVKAEAATLIGWLDTISRHPEAIAKNAKTTPPAIPQGMTPGDRQCSEPLLQIADAIGGHWPEKIRAALTIIFKLLQGSTGVELLCDIRGAFLGQNDPDHLATKDLLAILGNLEYRPWASWGSRSAKKLGTLLSPYGVRATEFRTEGGSHFRGYKLNAFQDAWERYVPPVPQNSGTRNTSGHDSGTR